MLGSAADADDVVQDAWLRSRKYDENDIIDAGAWLTTIVTRLSLDRLRARARRREVSIDAGDPSEQYDETIALDPEQEIILADSIGLALLVVLERLRPAERVAFVLHDLFGLPFEQVAEILSCSPVAARQLASRARRSLHGSSAQVSTDDKRKAELIEAFFNASRAGDMLALLRVLDPRVVLTIDPALTKSDGPVHVHGAEAVVERARLGAAQNLASRIMSVDGQPSIIVALAGRVSMVLLFVIENDVIKGIEIVANVMRIRRFTIAMYGKQCAV